MFNNEWYIRILIVLGILVFTGLFVISGLDNISMLDVVRKASLSTTAVLIFHYCFERYFWQYNWLRPLIVKVPKLHGTWGGILKSNWIDPSTGRELDPISVTVYIRQSFSNISVEVHTDKMVSVSYIAGFKTDPNTGVQELCYTYSSKAHVPTRDTNPWHDGTTKLSIFEGVAGIVLSGEYWTARKTTGTLELRRLSTSIERSRPVTTETTSVSIPTQ